MKKEKLKVLIFCLAIIVIVSVIGSTFTSKSVKSSWYDSIKPNITPPNWVFPVAWTILFILIAISMFFAWTNCKNKKDNRKVGWLFGVNLFLNVLWSFLFFKLQNPIFGFIDIVVLWVSILVLMIGVYKISKTASWLLLPYFLWVSFASIINYLAMMRYAFSFIG